MPMPNPRFEPTAQAYRLQYPHRFAPQPWLKRNINAAFLDENARFKNLQRLMH